MYVERRGAVTGAVLWTVRASRTYRVLPDGALDLMWWAGRLVVAGPDTTAFTAEAQPGAETFGLRLPLGVAPRVLRVPASELLNTRVALDELVPYGVRDDAGRRPHDLLERALLDLLAGSGVDAAELRLARFLDRGARRGVAVAELAAAAGMSDRSLHRWSTRVFGYGLKTLSGIRRFQRAADLVRAGRPLAEAAALAGYADQAHMTREVTRFAGAPPSRLAAS
jgi:AraC-like DNA-binding protein